KAGTLLSEIDRIQGEGKVPLLDLETEGALRVQDEVPGAVTIFVKAPSFAELERRLRERATESAGEIGVRLAVARRQLALEGRFDEAPPPRGEARSKNYLTMSLEEISEGKLRYEYRN